MHILGKHIDQLEPIDITNLIENSVAESKQLDFKRELDLSHSSKKKEFLFDIASFANTEGGCLVIGIDEKTDSKKKNTGIAGSIFGIIHSNLDDFTLQIHNLVRSGIQPSINVQVKAIEVRDKTVLVIGVNKTFALPCMVTFDKTNKFYRRNSAGKYLLDVYELNSAFMETNALFEEAKKFEEKRLNVYRENGSEHGCHTLIMPIGYFRKNCVDFDNDQLLWSIRRYLSSPHPINSFQRFNIDGALTFRPAHAPISNTCQVFRDWSVEFYSTEYAPDKNEFNHYESDGFDILLFEKETINALSKSLGFYKANKIDPPFWVFVCLTSMHEFKLSSSELPKNQISARNFDKGDLHLPILLITDYNINVAEKLKFVFDALWQAGGHRKSLHYDTLSGTRYDQF